MSDSLNKERLDEAFDMVLKAEKAKGRFRVDESPEELFMEPEVGEQPTENPEGAKDELPSEPGDAPEAELPKAEPDQGGEEDEIEQKKRSLFNSLSELIDLGRLSRQELTIRKYAEDHAEELGDQLDVLDDVVDMLIMGADVFRDPSTFKVDDPDGREGRQTVPAVGGGPETSTDQPTVMSDVNRVLKGEKIDEILEDDRPEPVEVGRTGVAIELRFETKDKRSAAKGAILQYKGIDSADETPENNGLVIFTTDTDPTEARNRVLSILQNARIGVRTDTGAFLGDPDGEPQLGEPGAVGGEPEVPGGEEPLGDEIPLGDEEPEGDLASDKAEDDEFLSVESAKKEGYKVVYEYAGPMADSPDTHIMSSPVSGVGGVGAGGDNAVPSEGGPEVPAGEEGVVNGPLFKLDVPESEEDEAKVADALNDAKDNGIILSWTKITPEEGEEGETRLVLEFRPDLEEEEIENFPAYIEGATGETEEGSGVEVSGFEAIEDEDAPPKDDDEDENGEEVVGFGDEEIPSESVKVSASSKEECEQWITCIKEKLHVDPHVEDYDKKGEGGWHMYVKLPGLSKTESEWLVKRTLGIK